MLSFIPFLLPIYFLTSCSPYDVAMYARTSMVKVPKESQLLIVGCLNTRSKYILVLSPDPIKSSTNINFLMDVLCITSRELEALIVFFLILFCLEESKFYFFY